MYLFIRNEHTKDKNSSVERAPRVRLCDVSSETIKQIFWQNRHHTENNWTCNPWILWEFIWPKTNGYKSLNTIPSLFRGCESIESSFLTGLDSLSCNLADCTGKRTTFRFRWTCSLNFMLFRCHPIWWTLKNYFLFPDLTRHKDQSSWKQLEKTTCPNSASTPRALNRRCRMESYVDKDKFWK
jgi:hypothetical protein